MPTYSIARPSRLVRESATTMRYCGLRILPIRRSRIFTATVLFAPDDYVGEPTEPTWGCGTDVSWTAAVGVRGRLARAEYQRPILPDGWNGSQSTPVQDQTCTAGRSQPGGKS